MDFACTSKASLTLKKASKPLYHMICSVRVFADRTKDLFLQCRYKTLRRSDAFLLWFLILIGLCFFLSKYSTETSSLA